MYLIPIIPTEDIYISKIYIDPSSPTNGAGTEADPMNELPATLTPETSYLIKRGTEIPERISRLFDQNFIGAYGVGEAPKLLDGLAVQGNSQYSVIRDLHVERYGTEQYTTILGFGNPRPVSITIAFCRFIGLEATGSGEWGHPWRAIENAAHDLTFFNNEVQGCRRNGWWCNGTGIKIIRNWFHNLCKSTEPDHPEYPVSSSGDGDIIQSIYDFQDGYIGGNIFDRSNSEGKYALMFNLEGHPSVPSTNIIVEYNTLVAPSRGLGGSTVRWVVGENCKLRKNVIDSIDKNNSIDKSNSSQWQQSEPYGIRDNHILIEDGRNVGPFGSPTRQQLLDQGNPIFGSYGAYDNYKTTNPNIGLYGSDINTETFLSENDTPSTDPPFYIYKNIIGSGEIILNPNKSSYDENEVVSVTASPFLGHKFNQWFGEYEGNPETFDITMDSNKNIGVEFGPISNIEEYIVQQASGIDNVTFPAPVTEGNLLVAIVAHTSSNPNDNQNIPAGFTLRENYQQLASFRQQGFSICDKIADGNETTFDLGYGASTDLGGIIMEFSVLNPQYIGSHLWTSDPNIPAEFTVDIAKPQLDRYLAVAGIVIRNHGPILDWGDDFIPSTEEVSRLGMATRIAPNGGLSDTVTVQSTEPSQGRGTIASVSYSFDLPSVVVIPITTNKEGYGSISIIPAKETYVEGEQIEILAQPAVDYKFTHWNDDTNDTVNPKSVTLTSEPYSITANFAIEDFPINPTEGQKHPAVGYPYWVFKNGGWKLTGQPGPIDNLNHNDLEGRDEEDAHTIESISGLSEEIELAQTTVAGIDIKDYTGEAGTEHTYTIQTTDVGKTLRIQANLDDVITLEVGNNIDAAKPITIMKEFEGSVILEGTGTMILTGDDVDTNTMTYNTGTYETFQFIKIANNLIRVI